MYSNRSFLLAALFLTACGGGSSSSVTVISVPASSTPTAATTSAPTQINIGITVTGSPGTQTTAPATMPAPPADASVVQSVNVTVVNVIVDYGYQASDDCTSFGLNDNEGYCDGETGLVMCQGGVVYYLDCSTWNDSACGYLDDAGGQTTDCLERTGMSISDAVKGDASFAFSTSDECSQGQEDSASCEGTFAVWCQGGNLLSLDCATYGSGITCGVNDQKEVDCLTP